MASTTLTCVDGQSWIYPPITYTGYDYIYKKANHWYNGHSDLDRRDIRCYQSGNSATDGRYNGNQMSIFKFQAGGQSLRSFISSIGGSGKITRITMYVTCGHSWYSSMTARVCLTPYWNTTARYGSGGIWECPYDDYGSLGFAHLTNVEIAKGSRKAIDLTPWKGHFDSYETIAFYVPGAYNKDYGAYGWIYAHKNSGGNIPQLVVEYSTNSAPHAPGVTIHTPTDGNGYTTPALDFSVISNGDPDNNLHSAPYSYSINNQNGNMIYNAGWTSHNRWQYDLSSYRGQTVKVTGFIRDSYDVRAITEKNIYINSKPTLSGTVNLSSGVTNGVYEDNVTISWNRGTDSQSQHNGNLRYYVYCQKGTDNGDNGDTESTRISSALTSTSYSFNAVNMTSVDGTRINVAKGERIYLSVWAWDGLEWSSNRITSQWIYREQPPSAPSNVTPASGHYESSVKASWSASQGANGTWVDHYRIELLKANNQVVKTYTTNQTEYTCNDVALIPRKDSFRFKVTAVDNLGNDSTPGYSGTCTRNQAPTNPKNFRAVSLINTLYAKGEIYLTWTPSTDNDGDEIRYDVYYNVNNGSFNELIKGVTFKKLEHSIIDLKPGDVLNYYIQAYDTFGVRSDKVYVVDKPYVNIPPEPPQILKPLNDRKVYCNVPRITFKTGTIHNNETLTIGVSVNGKKYNSGLDVNNFNKKNYGSEEICMFVPDESTPLNYSVKNDITIHASDGLDVSKSVSINIPVEFPTVKKITGSEDRLITAKHITDLQLMVDDTRFAYGFAATSWHKDYDKNIKVYKKYHEQIVDNIYSVYTYLNDNSKADHLKRNYTKSVISTGVSISKEIINNTIDMISRT